MARFSFQIAIILMFLNLGGGALVSAGVCADWGHCQVPGGGDVTDNVDETSQELVSSQAGEAGTLFMLFNVVTQDLIPALTLMVAGGPIMFHNLGFPDWATALIFGPAYLIIAADVAHLLMGRDTV